MVRNRSSKCKEANRQADLFCSDYDSAVLRYFFGLRCTSCRSRVELEDATCHKCGETLSCRNALQSFHQSRRPRAT